MPWRNRLLFTLSTLIVLFMAGAVYLAHERAMGLVHPGRTFPERTPEQVGLASVEDVRFPSSDGLLLAAWFIPPGEENPGPTVIFVHGLGANRSGLLDQAKLLVDHGYGALLLDLRNHGESEGSLTTMGYLEVEDIRGAVAYLLGRSEVDPQRIGILGHSLGGGIVIMAAARIPELRAVVAESAFTSLEDNIAQGVRQLTGLPPFPFAPLVIAFGEQEAGVDIQQVRPVHDVAQISPRAILLIHGEKDTLIEVGNARELYAAARAPKRLYVIANAAHSDLLEADPHRLEQELVDFLATYLVSR